MVRPCTEESWNGPSNPLPTLPDVKKHVEKISERSSQRTPDKKKKEAALHSSRHSTCIGGALKFFVVTVVGNVRRLRKRGKPKMN